MNGDQSPRFAVHQHISAVRTLEEAIDAFRPRCFSANPAASRSRCAAAQHGLVTSVYPSLPQAINHHAGHIAYYDDPQIFRRTLHG
jgi:hypothetical protein